MTNEFLKNCFLDEKTEKHFKNCVSLGWFCGTASSLSRLGLRNHSGPFDWILSYFWAVIEQIENEFKDFMIRDNLEVDDDNVKAFSDKYYGFHYNHDVENNFEDEYPQIYERYMRRVGAFLDMIKQPTVFFRCIRDNAEVEYINDKWEHIDELLKHFNPNNKIVYVCHSEIKGMTDKVKVFNLDIERYIGKTYEMRHMFDNCSELIEFSMSLIDEEQIKANINFDKLVNAQRATAGYVNRCVEEKRDGVDKMILEALGVTPEAGIYLWGAGKYGISLAQYLSDRGVTICGVIDNKKYDSVCENFTVISPYTIPSGAKIFIAVADKVASNSIMAQITEMDINACAVQYENLYDDNLDI